MTDDRSISNHSSYPNIAKNIETSSWVSNHLENSVQSNTMIPPWSHADPRLEVFPPHLSSSYLTREEIRTLHQLGINNKDDNLKNGAEFIHHTGKNNSIN